jgi:polyisoprenoid-binding protein YceI
MLSHHRAVPIQLKGVSMSIQFDRRVSGMALRLIGGAAIAMACGGVAQAAPVDTANSTISATSKQMNVPVDGTFRRFTANINFDPAKPQTSTAHIDIDTASYDLGSQEFNDSVSGKDWFDVTTYPHATFVSTSIAAAGTGKYNVNGKLTIKDKSANVTVPVTFSQRGTAQVFDGTLPISRLQFDIGASGEWKDTSLVADPVQIKFHLVVPAAK